MSASFIRSAAKIPAIALMLGLLAAPVLAESMSRYRQTAMADAAAPTPAEMSASVLPRLSPDAARFASLKEALAVGTNSESSAAASAAIASSLSLLTGFAGMNYLETGLGLFGFVPPDTNIAVGPSNIVEVANAATGIYDKSGNLLGLSSLYDFFGASLFTQIVSDPRVLYDNISGRWFISVLVASSALTSGGWRLAVSTTGDPLGSYYLYQVNTTGSFPDFPKMGMSDDKVVLTGDSFSGNTTFKGTEFFIANKQQLLSGAASVSIRLLKNQGMFALEPAQTLHPANQTVTTEYMVADNGAVAANGLGTTLRVWRINGVPGVGAGATVSHVDLALTPAIGFPPNAAQPGTTALVDTNDNSMLDAVWRNNIIWTAGNSGCIPPGDTAVHSCLRLIAVSTAGKRVVVQNFDYGALLTDYYFPAVRTDSVGDLVTGFSGSSTAAQSFVPSVLTAEQLATDPPNTLEAPVMVHQGDTAYTQASRWGDYSGAAVDPVDDTTIWVGGEYATSLAGSAWGTWIQSVSP